VLIIIGRGPPAHFAFCDLQALRERAKIIAAMGQPPGTGRVSWLPSQSL